MTRFEECCWIRKSLHFSHKNAIVDNMMKGFALTSVRAEQRRSAKKAAAAAAFVTASTAELEDSCGRTGLGG
jgi:hypothetical protein